MIKYEVLLAVQNFCHFRVLVSMCATFCRWTQPLPAQKAKNLGGSSQNDSRMPAGWDIKLTGNWRSESCFFLIKIQQMTTKTTERHQEFIRQGWKSSRVDGSAWSAGPLCWCHRFLWTFPALPWIFSGVWDCVGIRVVDWRGYIFLEQCAVQRSTKNVYWHSRISRLTMAGCLCNSKTNQISWNAISEVPRPSTERWFQFDKSTSLDWNACFRKKHPVKPWP